MIFRSKNSIGKISSSQSSSRFGRPSRGKRFLKNVGIKNIETGCIFSSIMTDYWFSVLAFILFDNYQILIR